MPSGQPVEHDLTNLKDTAARGVAWSALKAVSSPLIRAGVIVILAWKLTPADFGTVAFAMVFIALISLMVESGFGLAIIQRNRVTQTDLNSAFWMNILLSVALALLLIGLADVLVMAVAQPQLASVLRVLSLVFVFSAVGSVPQAVLRRNLAFGRVAMCQLGGTVVGGAVAVAMAMAGAGVWSLVAQMVVAGGVTTAVAWAMSTWRPGGPVSAASIRELFHFSRHIFGGQLAGFASRYSDNFLIGVVLGPVALGIYAVAYRIVEIIKEAIVWTLEDVTFALLSRLADDPQRRERAFFGLTGLCAAVALPTFLFLAVSAPEMTRLVLGSRWAEAIPVMQMLAFVGISHSALSCNKAVLNSAGRPDLTLFIGIVNGVLCVAGFAATVHWGILAVATSYVVCSYLVAPLSTWFAIRVLSLSAVSYIRVFAGPAVSGLVMVVCVLGTKAALEDKASDLGLLLLSLVVATTTYGAMLYVTARRQALDLVQGARRLRTKSA